MAQLKPYHYAWLSVHRNRTADWLSERLADGFDIHHRDGDHSNDDPANLVLIECTDHMRLHGTNLNRLLRDGRATVSLGREAYEMKSPEYSWLHVGKALKPDSIQPSSWARGVAEKYAAEAGLPFPKPGCDYKGYNRAFYERA